MINIGYYSISDIRDYILINRFLSKNKKMKYIGILYLDYEKFYHFVYSDGFKILIPLEYLIKQKNIDRRGF